MAVPLGLHRALEVGIDAQPTAEHQGVHHLVEGLPRFTTVGRSRDDQFELRVGIHGLMRRHRRAPQREHADHTNEHTDGPERDPRWGHDWPPRRVSRRIGASSTPRTSWPGTVTSSTTSCTSEQISLSLCRSSVRARARYQVSIGPFPLTSIVPRRLQTNSSFNSSYVARVIWISPGVPWDSIRLAVFTASPQRS